jgi:phenylacetate-CoA ligase
MLHDAEYSALGREELVQLQIERLQSTLNRVYRNVAFYRHSFDRHKVNIERIKSLEALRELPFTTRADLGASYPYDMFAVPLREVVRIHAASGVSGTPIVMGYTRNDLAHWAACSSRLLAATGVSANDVVQIAFSYNLSPGGFGFQQGAEMIGASVIPASITGSAGKQAIIMRDFKATVLICTPSYGRQVAAGLEEMRIHPERLHLRLCLLGGEPWPKGFRQEIEARLRVPCLDTYGISEVMEPGLAGECADRTGLHINEDHFIVEVIDPLTLTPVAAGAAGELVFTTITKEGFPVIRYRTGDIASVDIAPCKCGRTFARMSPVSGRTDDRFYFHGVGLFPAQIEGILKSLDGASPHFRIILDRDKEVDTMEVKVEMSEQMPSFDEVRQLERLRGELSRRIETVLDIQAKVSFVEPRSLRASPEAKVVDRRGISVAG